MSYEEDFEELKCEVIDMDLFINIPSPKEKKNKVSVEKLNDIRKVIKWSELIDDKDIKEFYFGNK